MNTRLVTHQFAMSPPPGHATVNNLLTRKALQQQNRKFQGTAGVSAGNRSQGFAPAFLDRTTGAVYRACFKDGRPAPMHLLDGLPPELVVARNACGGVVAVKDSVIAGFIRCGEFFTREQAAAAVGG